MANFKSSLLDPKLSLLVMATLVDRLGGTVIITQTDIDNMSYNVLNESYQSNGDLKIDFQKKKISS